MRYRISCSFLLLLALATRSPAAVVQYSVTYKRRKVGPELNTEKKREPL